MKKDEIMERWTEYVKELYKDKNRRVDDIIDISQIENEVQYMQSVAKRLKLRLEICQKKSPAVVTTFLLSYYSAWGRKVYR